MNRLFFLVLCFLVIVARASFADEIEVISSAYTQKCSEELVTLRKKLSNTQEALSRLKNLTLNNSAEIEEWGRVTDQAVRESWEQAGGMFVDLTLGLLDSRLEQKLKKVNRNISHETDILYGTVDPNKRQELNNRLGQLFRERQRLTEAKDVIVKHVSEANDVLKTYTWAASNTNDLQKSLEGVYKLVKKVIADEKIQDILKISKEFGNHWSRFGTYAKYAVDACYNDWAVIASMKRITEMNKNSLDYLEAVNVLSERTKKLVMQIKEKEAEQAALSRIKEPDEEVTTPAPPKKWELPKSPGGIALRPSLSISGNTGRIEEITTENGKVILVTSTGKYIIDSINPQCFATIFRTIARGEIPYITIGSEPSSHDGYAKVTYASSLYNTREGLLLYRADKQFKAIFAYYPFGDDYQLNTPTDTLVPTYPGPGGEFTRLWITSSGIQLKIEGEHIVLAHHGMRINAETTLLGDVQSDWEMEEYARKLTEHWDSIADHVFEFRAIEDLAEVTAIAFWVRQNRVRVNPTIWDLPPIYMATPEYVPVVGYIGKTSGVAGGVALAPEDKAAGEGRLLLYQIARIIDGAEQNGRSVILNRILFGGLAIFSVIILISTAVFVLWIFLNSHFSYFQLAKVYGIMLVIQGGLTLLAAPLIYGELLSSFDSDFLSLCVTFLVSPVVFLACMNRTAGWPFFEKRRFIKTASFFYSLTIPLLTGLIGISLSVMTVCVFGLIPGKSLDTLLTAELRLSDTALRATMSGIRNPESQEIFVYPVPFSLAKVFQDSYQQYPNQLQGDLDDIIRLTSPKDSFFPVNTLRKIQWPDNMPTNPEIVHYSVNGYPP